MDEILQKLIDNDLLSESTRAQLSEQIKASVEAFKQTTRNEVQAEVRAELAESWVTERDQLVNKLDTFLSEALSNEIDELKADVERFRDHEAQQAAKIVGMRKKMAHQVAEEMDTLVDKLDTFLESRIKAEFEELREDLDIARQNDFGRKIFEAYKSTFNVNFVDSKSIQQKLNVTESRLREARTRLKQVEAEKSLAIRESKMNQVLSPLSGTARDQMSIILKSVPTEQLEESYKHFIPRVLRESTQAEKTALAESTGTTVVKTGNPVTESKTQSQPQSGREAEILRMRKLAGLN